MHKTLLSIKVLKQGWFDNQNDGKVFKEKDLLVISEFLEYLDQAKINYFVYPHPDEEISVEFDIFKPEMISVDYKLSSNEVLLHSYNLETKAIQYKTVALTQGGLVREWLNRFVG